MLCILLIHWGSSKEACTFWASSWKSLTSGISTSSCHQLGVSTAHPLHSTHLSYSSAGGSGEELLPPSSLDLLAGSWKKCLTSSPSSIGGLRSNTRKGSSASSSFKVSRPHWGGLCVGEWAGLSSSKALLCLLLHPQDLLLHWLQLWEWAWASGQPLVMDWLSLSIFSSNAMVVARALWWASLASVSLLSAEVSCPPSVESCFASGKCQQVLTLPISLAVHPLSTLGSFSRRTPHPL